MSFVRVKPLSWAFGEILTSAQMNTLDTDHANAVDGLGGGTYNPTAQLFIDAGVTATPLRVGGTFQTAGFLATGTAQFNGGAAYTVGTYQVASGATFQANSGSTITFNAQLNMNHNLVVDATHAFTALGSGNSFQGGTTFTGSAFYDIASGSTLRCASGGTISVLAGGQILCASNTTIQSGGSLILSSGSSGSVNSAMTLGGAGRIIPRVITTGLDATITFNASTATKAGDFFKVTTHTATRAWTLTTTGASTNDVVVVSVTESASSSFYIEVKNDGGTNILVLRNASGDAWLAAFYYDGAAWSILWRVIKP